MSIPDAPKSSGSNDNLGLETSDKLIKQSFASFESNQYEDCITSTNLILSEDPYNHQARFLRARSLLELQEYKAAVEDFRIALESHPDANHEQFRSLAHHYQYIYGRIEDQSNGGFGVPQSVKNSKAWSIYNRALSYYYLCDYSNAIEDFSLMIKECPQFAAAYRCRGTAYFKIGNFKDAILDLQQSNLLEPTSTAFYNLGQACGNESRYEQAIVNFTQAISLNPQDSAPYNGRGISFKNTQQFDSAIADFSVAISLNQNYSSAYDHRAQCYANQGHKQLALADLSKAISIQPQPVRYHRRALINWDLENKTNALDDISIAISTAMTNEQKASWLSVRGRFYLDRQDWSNAEVDFNQCISLTPNDSLSYFRRAIVAAARGNYKQAKEDSWRAVELDSELSRLRKILELSQCMW